MNDTEGSDTERRERRARAWAERAREQLSAVEARLAARYRRHLHARFDPRDAREVLRQLAARRLLPLGHGLRQASTHDAGVLGGGATASDRRARQQRRPELAFLQLSRADRAALWPLRPLSAQATPVPSPSAAGGAHAATSHALLPEPSRELAASARRAALRRLAERLGAERDGEQPAGVGGID